MTMPFDAVALMLFRMPCVMGFAVARYPLAPANCSTFSVWTWLSVPTYWKLPAAAWGVSMVAEEIWLCGMGVASKLAKKNRRLRR